MGGERPVGDICVVIYFLDWLERMNSGEGLGRGGGLVDMGGFTGGNLLLAETCRTFLVEYENINLNLIYFI